MWSGRLASCLQSLTDDFFRLRPILLKLKIQKNAGHQPSVPAKMLRTICMFISTTMTFLRAEPRLWLRTYIQYTTPRTAINAKLNQTKLLNISANFSMKRSARSRLIISMGPKIPTSNFPSFKSLHSMFRQS